MTTLRRLTSLLAVMAMLLTLTAIPAFAVAQGTATVTTGDLLSGQGGLVTVKIDNNASTGTLGIGSGSSIDAFVIEVPQDLVDVAAADVTLPSGWQGGYDSEIGFIFAEADDGSELPPGESLNVEIGVTADPQADDLTRPFTTHVSDNGGMTLSSAGTPEVTTRILKIVDVTVVKPSSATNTDTSQVTAGQDNATFELQVRNFGTQLRNVTADVTTDDGKSSSNGLQTTPATQDLASGTAAVFEVGATFGDTGTLVVDGAATSTNSAAETVESAAITVQAAFAANFVGDSLQPQAAVQGSTEDFVYRINKTAGAQPVDGSATFRIVNPDGTDFVTSQDQLFDAATGEKNVNFDGVLVPDFANDTYDTRSKITGTDANGATVSLDLNLDDLTLDDLLPVVNITATPEANDIENTAAASSDGRTVFFDGTIGLSSGTGKCTDCTVTKAVFVAQPSGQEFPIDLNNAGGDLTGSGEFDYPDGTTSAVAKVTAIRNDTGAADTDTSNTVTVDLKLPVLTKGTTFRDTDADKIIVPLSDDGIYVDTTPSTALDWSVDNNTVTAVEGRPAAGRATEVVLTLQNRLDPNATPTVSYAARPLATGRMHDRVSLEVLDQVINTVDGIIPDAPVIETVNGLGLQDGEFWINDSTPDVGLTDLVPGNTLQIFYDTNDNGTADDGESVYNNPITEESEVVTLANLGNDEVSHKLIARMKDTSGNLGVIDQEVLNLDFTAATITGFSVAGQDVTVTFDEPVVRGRDAAFDWTVLATDASGVQAHRTVTSVTVGATNAERVLTISEASFDASAGGTVDGVRYKFRGFNPDDRYEDRATNLFGDVLFTKP